MTATIENQTTTSTTFTVTTYDAHRWLKASLVCAGKDDTLPMLTGVRLRHVGNSLVLDSTDRFRLGMVRIEAMDGSRLEFDNVLMNGADVKQAAAILKPVSVREREVYVDFTVTPEGVTFKRWDGVAGTIRTLDYDFPKVENLLKVPSPEDEGVASFTVDAKFLSDFYKTRFTPRDQMSLYPAAPGRPIRVAVGDHFRGLVMPLREPEGGSYDKWDSWDGIF